MTLDPIWATPSKADGDGKRYKGRGDLQIKGVQTTRQYPKHWQLTFFET